MAKLDNLTLFPLAVDGAKILFFSIQDDIFSTFFIFLLCK